MFKQIKVAIKIIIIEEFILNISKIINEFFAMIMVFMIKLFYKQPP